MSKIIEILLLVLAVVAAMDFLFDRISNWWILLLLVTGLSFAAWKGGLHGFVEALVSAAVPALILYPLFMIGGLGAGDVKLLAVVGGFLPVRKAVFCLAVSFLIGAVFSLLKMAAERSFAERMGYLMSYLCGVFKSGKWELYAQDIKDGRERKRGKIHFALPVLISVMLFAGGVY